MKIPEISGVHRPPEGQGQNGVTRAQSWTGGGGGGVARGGRYGKNITIFLEISQFTILSRFFCHVGFSILQVV